MERAVRKEAHEYVREVVATIQISPQGWSENAEDMFTHWLSDRIIEMQNGDDRAFVEYFSFAFFAVAYSLWRKDMLYNMRLINLVNGQIGMVRSAIRKAGWLDKDVTLAHIADFLDDFNDSMGFCLQAVA
jgi:hypothetical protein